MTKHTFILADEKVNSHGYRLLMSGVNLDRFRANPVALFNHQDFGRDYTGPIGQWENIRVEGGQLKADFAPDNEDEFAAKIAGKVERGVLKGASVGINLISYSEDPAVMLLGQKYPTVTEWDIFEASVVDIPASQGALRLRYNGEDIIVKGDGDMAKLGFSIKQDNNSNSDMKYPESVLAALGLEKDATDVDVLSAIQKKTADEKKATDALKVFEDKLKADNETAAKTFADALKAELKLTDEKAESMRKLHMNDSALALETATLMRGGKKDPEQRRTLRSDLGLGASTSSATGGDGRDSWNIRDWEKKDPKGLLSMKRDTPEDYKTLFEKTYK